jgi:hypothetical protein
MGKKKMPAVDPNKPPGLDDEIDEETLKVRWRGAGRKTCGGKLANWTRT